jgi:MFS family permease
MKQYETLIGCTVRFREVSMRYVLAGALLGGTSPGAPSLNPDAGGLPGASTLQRLANGIGGWALIAAMMGIVVGAVLWAFGHYSQNYQQAYNGRRGVMVSALAAVLIGGAPHIISFFLNQGNGILS